jgi:uncharacterized phage protein (TIGR02220 family)
MSGWIKLHRKITQNPVFNDPHLLKLWIWCLTEASHKEHEVIVGRQVVKLMPGQFITGRFQLHDAMFRGATRDQQKSPKTVWRWLETLENLDFLTIKTTNKFSLCTVEKWAEYQFNDQQFDQQVTNKCPTDDQQVTTNNNVKELKEGLIREKKLKPLSDEPDDIPYSEIINFMNQKCETNYRATGEATKKHIRARWNDGFRLDDFKTVINKKAKEWIRTDQAKYLRPETLFGNKFEGYLNQRERGEAVETSRRADNHHGIRTSYTDDEINALSL